MEIPGLQSPWNNGLCSYPIDAQGSIRKNNINNYFISSFSVLNHLASFESHAWGRSTLVVYTLISIFSTCPFFKSSQKVREVRELQLPRHYQCQLYKLCSEFKTAQNPQVSTSKSETFLPPLFHVTQTSHSLTESARVAGKCFKKLVLFRSIGLKSAVTATLIHIGMILYLLVSEEDS